jgi:hypothetical protein
MLKVAVRGLLLFLQRGNELTVFPISLYLIVHAHVQVLERDGVQSKLKYLRVLLASRLLVLLPSRHVGLSMHLILHQLFYQKSYLPIS